MDCCGWLRTKQHDITVVTNTTIFPADAFQTKITRVLSWLSRCFKHATTHRFQLQFFFSARTPFCLHMCHIIYLFIYLLSAYLTTEWPFSGFLSIFWRFTGNVHFSVHLPIWQLNVPFPDVCPSSFLSVYWWCPLPIWVSDCWLLLLYLSPCLSICLLDSLIKRK